jgi:hypothetical protein
MANRNLHKWLTEYSVVMLILAPLLLTMYHNVSGDAAVYFIFIRNFFTLPFSYQPDTVSFGATSPLHVVLYAPIYQIFGTSWLAISKTINFLLVVSGVVFINRAINGNTLALALLSGLTLLNATLLTAAFQLYESSLAFFAMTLLYYCIKQQKYTSAVWISGLLYLIRPELALITIVADIYIFRKATDKKRLLFIALLSFLPAIVYHVYMFAFTGQYLPSSVYARMITASEKHVSWSAKLALSLRSMANPLGLIYLIGFFSVIILAVQKKLREYPVELLLTLPLSLLYLAFPPGDYMARYLLPVTPTLSVLVLAALHPLLNRWLRKSDSYRPVTVGINPPQYKHALIALGVLCVAVHAVYAVMVYMHPRYDYETLLMKDMAQSLNTITDRSDKILIYEIQGQYYLNAFCYSLDGIVGNQLLDVLTRKESFAHFIRREKVGYIVTMNSFNYRSLYDNTLLEQLYEHDLQSKLRDSVQIDGVVFQKILTNPVFSDSTYYDLKPIADLNTGTTTRVYGDWNPLWKGHPPMWNSVYKIIQ